MIYSSSSRGIFFILYVPFSRSNVFSQFCFWIATQVGLEIISRFISLYRVSEELMVQTKTDFVTNVYLTYIWRKESLLQQTFVSNLSNNERGTTRVLIWKICHNFISVWLIVMNLGSFESALMEFSDKILCKYLWFTFWAPDSVYYFSNMREYYDNRGKGNKIKQTEYSLLFQYLINKSVE